MAVGIADIKSELSDELEFVRRLANEPTTEDSVEESAGADAPLKQ